MKRTLPRLMIAGTGSGCGKTTAVCAVLGALKRRGTPLAAYKCGPDYIDPMFHREVLGVPSRNLDLFLCGENTVRYLLARNTPSESVALLEGVMGFYDGLSGGDTASSAHLSRATGTPAVMVVNVRGKALSLAAEINGYKSFAPNLIRGVILNQVPPRSYPLYREIVERHCSVEILGYLPPIPEAALDSRHLGLVTAGELADLQGKTELMALQAGETLNLDRLLQMAGEAVPLEYEPVPLPDRGEKVRVAVAVDGAFCFYYADNLDLLEELGAELVPFSPLEDKALPENIQGLLLGGGYPELYAAQLSANTSMRESVRLALAGGLPTIAECGGFLYLGTALEDMEGNAYPMAGFLPGMARMTKRLSRFGYSLLTAKEEGLLCGAGERVPTHEFHYSECDDNGRSFLAEKPGKPEAWECIHSTPTLWAGYPHLHFWSNPGMANRFLDQCRREKSR